MSDHSSTNQAKFGWKGWLAITVLVVLVTAIGLFFWIRLYIPTVLSAFLSYFSLKVAFSDFDDDARWSFSVEGDLESTVQWLIAVVVGVPFLALFGWATIDSVDWMSPPSIAMSIDTYGGKYVRWGAAFMNVAVAVVILCCFFVSMKVCFLGPKFTPTLVQLARRRLWGTIYRYVGLGLVVTWIISIVVAYSTWITEPFILLLRVATLTVAVSTLGPAVVLFIARRALLKIWFPALHCPACRERISLVREWDCPGGCEATGVRHAMAPCPMCGTKPEGVDCPNEDCDHGLLFSEEYNEFEILSRGKKYVTVCNVFYWGAMAGLSGFATAAYVCYQLSNLDGFYCFLVLVVLSGAVLIKLSPRRLLKNPFFPEEDPGQQ